MRITLRQLEYVEALARTLHFGRAAEECFVSQPGLSKQIAQTESVLGVTLFERDRRTVRVTEAGEEVARRARAILGAARDLEALGPTLAEPLTGTLNLGVIPTVAPYALPSALDVVRRRHPHLRLVLREEPTARLVSELDAGRLDVLLLALDADLGAARTLPLFEDRFVAALPVGHRLAKRKRLTTRDLVDEPLLLLEDGHCLKDQVLELCHASGGVQVCDVRASSLGTLVQMVAGGLGVTLIPELAIAANAVPTDHLRLVPFARPAPHRTIGLAWRPSDPRADAFELLGAALLDGVEDRGA